MGLCLERGPEMVVGAAGRAQGRRRVRAAGPGVSRRAAGATCWQDAARRVLVTQASLRAARSPAPTASRWSSVDARRAGDRGGAADEPRGARRRAGQPGVRHLHLRLHRARPRGWWCRTAALVNLRRVAGRGASASARATACCSSPRSASTRRCAELFAPLVAGARMLLVVARARCRGPAACGRAARRAGTIASASHRLPQAVLARVRPADRRRCARWSCGGEALPAARWSGAHARASRRGEPLRAHGGHHLRHLHARWRGGRRARPPSAGRGQRAGVRAGRARRAGAGGRAGRAVHRRGAAWRAATWAGRR